MSKLKIYLPQITQLVLESQAKLEQTTSANVGAYGIPIGGVLRQTGPATMGHIVPTGAGSDKELKQRRKKAFARLAALYAKYERL
jgi:hypothetical protein